MVVGIELQPAGAGVTVRSYAECSPASTLTRLLRGVIRSSVADALEFCRSLPGARGSRPGRPGAGFRTRSAVNRAQLDQRLGPLPAAPSESRADGLVKERILEGSDDQLTGIRPFALADLWRADRLDA